MRERNKRHSQTALIIPDGRTRVYDRYIDKNTGKSKFDGVPLPAKDVFIGRMSDLCRQYAEKYYDGHWFFLTTNNNPGQDYFVEPDEKIEGWYDNPPYPIPNPKLVNTDGKPQYWQPFSDGGIQQIRDKVEELGILDDYTRIIFLGNHTDEQWWKQKSWDDFITNTWNHQNFEDPFNKDHELFSVARTGEYEYSLYVDALKKVFREEDGIWLEFPLIDCKRKSQMISRISDAIYRGFPLRRPSYTLLEGKVDNLFCMNNPSFSYGNIPLGNQQHVQMITAPNGFGKSTIFRLIRAVFAGNIKEIASIPFDKLELTLADNLHQGKEDAIRLTVENHSPNKNNSKPSIIISKMKGDFLAPQKFVEIFNTDLLLDRNSSDWEQYQKKMGKKLGKVIPPLSIRYLPADRLWHDTLKSTKEYDILSDSDSTFPSNISSSDDPSRIEEYATSLARRIEGMLTDFAVISHENDTKFPTQLLKNIPISDGNEIYNQKKFNSLKTEFTSLDEFREELENESFLPFRKWYRKKNGDDYEEVSPFEYTNLESNYPMTFQQFMEAYLQKQKEKYDVFTWLGERCEKFEDIINDLLIFTQIRIQNDRGFSFYNNFQSEDERVESRFEEVPIRKISSGEMHQVVMYYDSLFNCDPGTCILIDEPEISMHIVWQEQYIDNILKIAQKNQANFLIATHSPYIIGYYPELAFDLEED